jgi:hypothetical protein
MDCNLTSQWMLSLLGILSCNSYSKVCITISIIISLATNVTSHCDVELQLVLHQYHQLLMIQYLLIV